MIRYLKGAVICGALVVVAGCGFQQVQPNGPTPVPTTPPPTPVPTISVSGGAVAATVEGTKIPMSLFQAFVNDAYKSSAQNGSPITAQAAAHQALGELIETVVSLNEAKKYGVMPSTSKLNTSISQAETSNGGRAKFVKTLSGEGLTLPQFKWLEKSQLAESALETKIAIKPTSGPVATAREILVAGKEPIPASEAFFTQPVKASVDRCTNKTLSFGAAKTEAQKLLQKLKSGSSFASLAKKCSDDTYSSSTGGWLLGPSNNHTLYPYVEGFAPNFNAAVFSGKVGEYQLFGSLDGWHIIQVESRKNQKYPTKVSSTTGLSIPQDIQEAHFSSWLNGLAQQAYKKTVIKEHVS